MWSLLYRLASPKQFYQLINRLIPWLIISCSVLFLIGLSYALWFSPPDYQQGHAVRIMYLHVPSAIMSVAIYSYMAFLAILTLVWRIKIAGMLMGLCAPIGAMMTFLALLTGSIWGKPMWGTWWVWDARLTSELILLFIYLGIIALKQSITPYQRSDKAVAIMVLVGVVDLPIIHYSVNWWNTLHQTSSFSLFAKPSIASSMLFPLLCMLSAFFCYFLLALALAAKTELLKRERKSNWVTYLIDTGDMRC